MYTYHVYLLVFHAESLTWYLQFVLWALQRSEYEDVCLNEECIVKIEETEDHTGSNEAISKSGHVPSSSVNITTFHQKFE